MSELSSLPSRWVEEEGVFEHFSCLLLLLIRPNHREVYFAQPELSHFCDVQQKLSRSGKPEVLNVRSALESLTISPLF